MPTGHKTQLRIGDTYGEWTVVDELEPAKYATGTARRVLAECSCGNKKIIPLGVLTRGRSTMCMSCSNRIKAEHNKTHKLTGTREYSMWQGAKYRAKKKGIEFSVEPTDIVIPDVCPVLGIRLGCGNVSAFYSPSSPTIDRFDNSIGYTKDNIRIISWRANSLKKDATVDEIRRVLEYMEHG